MKPKVQGSRKEPARIAPHPQGEHSNPAKSFRLPRSAVVPAAASYANHKQWDWPSSIEPSNTTPLDRLARIIDGVGNTQYSYDAARQVLTEDGP